MTLLVLAGGLDQASAATFTAGCSGTAGDVASLVAAMTSANTTGGADTVQLGARCVYTLTVQNSYWYGPDGLPPITSNITIAGNGATIERSSAMGTPSFRLFYVAADPNNPNTFNYVVPSGSESGGGQLTLRDLTLRGGFAKGGDSNGGGGGAGFGGAIFNQGIVVIERSTLTANLAEGGSAINSSAQWSGGGIGSNSSNAGGGGFGPGTFGGGTGGTGSGGGGGGAGFAVGENGAATANSSGGNGGGPATGLGGAGAAGSAGAAGAAGDGSGGGGGSSSGALFGGASGGAFGKGAPDPTDNGYAAGGGGVGGGGGARSGAGLGAGGGGFGGGGGGSVIGSSMISGGKGGFGGGGGGASTDGGSGGASGFGGGAGTSAGGGGGAGMGGAIFNMQGSLIVRNSTIAGNEARGGTDHVVDHGKGYGGAVFTLNGSFIAEDSTIALNTALTNGAAIYNLAYDAVAARIAQMTLRDTIVANDSGPYDLFSDKSTYITPSTNQSGAVADVGHFDLVRTMSAFGTTITGSPLTADPLLGALQDNGGPTATMTLAPTSPAIDAGSSFSLGTDQRGDPRPVDFSGVGNATGGDGSDIGAYEWQRCNGQTSPTQACHTVTVSLAGSGTGGVSDGAAISCPGACAGTYVEGSTVTVAAQPAAGSDFAGWSGACIGTGACTITVDSDKAITATFTQRPPSVTTSAPGNPGPTSATLAGTVNPLGSATSYHFEYGKGSAYGASVPVPDANAGFDAVPHAESQLITGLAPATTYHFRLVATNVGGTSYSADATFTTASIRRPILSGLTLHPSRFRAARHGATTASGRRPPIGTTITYRDTTSAVTTLTVVRTSIGVRSGKRCVARRGPLSGHARRCSRQVRIGRFRHSDTQGINRVRFTGRVGGRRLMPRSYTLLATASNAAGASKRLAKRFEIVG